MGSKVVTKSKKNTNEISEEEMMAAMDIVRGMSYEEVQAILKANPLYNHLLKIDEQTKCPTKKK